MVLFNDKIMLNPFWSTNWHGLVLHFSDFFNYFVVDSGWRLSDKDKDLEVIILRHQLAVMSRLHAKPVKPNRAEKMSVLCNKYI